MGKRIIAFLCLAFFLIEARSLVGQLDELLHATDQTIQERMIKKIIASKPDVDSLIYYLKHITFPEPESRGLIREENLCIDGIKRPFYWYLPASYKSEIKTPLLVFLHGGVSRNDIIDDFEQYARECPFLEMADECGYIILFPLGQSGATWWDSVGIANIRQQIRRTKQKFNIDDDRVYLAGFSDGASGSFLFAMCDPTDFAAFIMLNGHPGVGSIDGGIQTYFINLFNRPSYVVNTGQDEFYPAHQMSPMIELAQSAGGNIRYRIYAEIGHSFDYAEEELPLITEFMASHPRSLPSIIKWETAYPGLGCDWIVIDSITSEGHADWYVDHNMELTDDRVMFGFLENEAYEGPGVMVDKVIGDSTLCALLGINEGDVFVKLDGRPINDITDMAEYKKDKRCGDEVGITINRGGKIIEMSGRFPGPTKYYLFRRNLPSARVEAYLCANKLSLRASQLGGFTFYLHPQMIKLDQPVVIELNGRKIFEQNITYSPETILRGFLQDRDRSRIFVNKISVQIR